MDQIKIGQFIKECRNKNNLTQMQLAEKLGITDRAISKWENGRAMPDSAIMLDLCKELKITVNELLSGEMIEMKNYRESVEKNLLDMVKQKEEADKRLLTLEVFIGVLVTIIFLSFTRIIKDEINSDAVSITDRNEVLAYVGVGEEAFKFPYTEISNITK